ncbi:MAG TPA: UDP-2,4-diacetamido-2,4,6-trideoxy-beta-L-altropyranose hydrolase [Trichormus sp. M33_DOE_039]|nr:UDP-2,4-diacetamido-2,4,6-trideoxy-beta-L-altropyranose hydrolase [Trichormus sp. M33_DOE_039]
MNLLFRVDVSPQIGTGHLMRCLALAQAWQQAGGKAVFIMAETAFIFEEKLRTENIEVIKISPKLGSPEDAQATAMLAHQLNSNWLVIDGYNFGDIYQTNIKNAGLKVLFLDDYGHAGYYCADLVLNQNLSADPALYTHKEPDTQLLLGTFYTLLRREFWQWRGWQRVNPPIAKKILVTMGGADYDNVTLKVIQALQLLSGHALEIVVVIGGSNPYYEEIKLVAQTSGLTIRIERNVNSMPELMAWADIAVTAGGSTCWELAFMGLPSLSIILAKNQQAITQKLHSLQTFINLGWHSHISPSEIATAVEELSLVINTRLTMTKSSQELVDGWGSQRVVRCIKNYSLKLRPVSIEDCQLLWQWANETEVRAVSFSSKPIAWEEHQKWFNSKLNTNCIFYIAVNQDNIPIGQIRYDIEGKEAVISISIAQEYRQQGYGTYLIEIAQRQIFQNLNIHIVHAYIKPSNQASIKAFRLAGFHIRDTVIKQGQQAIHLVDTANNLPKKIYARDLYC